MLGDFARLNPGTAANGGHGNGRPTQGRDAQLNAKPEVR
jgi:hypothetical protein